MGTVRKRTGLFAATSGDGGKILPGAGGCVREEFFLWPTKEKEEEKLLLSSPDYTNSPMYNRLNSDIWAKRALRLQ